MIRCNVSEDARCEAPAALEDGEGEPIRTKCYRCGLPTCRSCSKVDRDPMLNDGRRTRRCLDCREQAGEPT